MGNTAIIQSPGDLTQTEFIINQQLLGILNSLENHIFFNGNALFFRKYIAQVVIILSTLIGHIAGKIIRILCLLWISDQVNDQILNILDKLKLMIFY